jgi:arylsulfatase
MEFACDDTDTRGGPATVRLFCNDSLVGTGRIPRQVRGRFGECLDVGEDSLSPVWGGYRSRLPFRFSGRIERIELHLGEAAELTTGELIDEQVHRD